MRPKISTPAKKKGGEGLGAGRKSLGANMSTQEVREFFRRNVDYEKLFASMCKGAMKGNRNAKRFLKEVESERKNNPEVMKVLRRGKMKAGKG